MGISGKSIVKPFRAQELLPGGSFGVAAYAFRGNETGGYTVEREGRPHLELPAGYRLLKTLRCGICSTDLARPHLPFALPQIIGHELLAEDGAGRLSAAEINASHAAVDSPAARACAFCSGGLPTHCPDRLVLGIDRLPGGFGPYVLVPRRNVVPVPAGMPPDTAVLVEPFAAALHAARTVHLAEAGSAAVLGAGRLGLLVTAALAAVREERGLSFTIIAVEPNPLRARKARLLGADTVLAAADGAGRRGGADVVVEATGSPRGLELALRMARREVHVKSTTGKAAMGFGHLTEMVVDEIALEPFSSESVERLAAADGRTADAVGNVTADAVGNVTAVAIGNVTAGAEKTLRSHGLAVCRLAPDAIPAGGIAGAGSRAGLEQAAIAVVSSLEDADRVLRPWPGREQGLVRPRGAILIEKQGAPSGLPALLFAGNLSITTSRCGDLRKAFAVMTALQEKGVNLGEILVTHRVPAGDLGAAMALATRPEAVKVVVQQTHS